MLQTLRAYSSWSSAVEVPLEPLGRAETDLFQIRNIEGLGPVNAEINTSALGSSDGHSYVGSAVGARNIVLTIKPNPDWAVWTYEKLRQLLYRYFMPKRMVRLVFETDEFPAVEIFGYVETNEPQLFSKDGEIQISIICPYPYFTSVDPITVEGTTAAPGTELEYEGTVETGINVQVSYGSGSPGAYVTIQTGNPYVQRLSLVTTIDANNYYVVNTIPGQKYVQTVNPTTGVITNRLSELDAGFSWPYLQPGENIFLVSANVSGLDWVLTYYNRYGGL